ncbi:MAG: type IV secretory system conjugative DNA transfer family protein [Proteus vulgaris]
MERTNKKPIEIIIAVFVVVVLASIAGVFAANKVFLEWQKIPSEFYSYHLLFDYKDIYGDPEKYPKVAKAIKFCFGIMIAVPILATIAFLYATFSGSKRELHGSAKFANLMEVKKAGLLLTPKAKAEKKLKTPSQPSLLIGKFKDKYLEFFGNEFLFVAAPTRSGKGVGIVIPNLLHYQDSVVVLDVKNENWDITAGFRSKHQECFLFAPKAENGKSHGYNPLDYIDRDHAKRMADIQNISNILFPSNSAEGTTAFFNLQAQRLFTGLVLYMLETSNRPCTLAELMKLTTPTDGKPFNEWIINTINDRAQYEDDDKVTPPLTAECKSELMSFAGNSSENTRAGILSSMTAPLNIFTDPSVAAATSKSDFRLDDLRRKKMSIYVGIQPNELPRFDKLLNLFFSQLINLNTRVLPEHDDTLKYQCLVLLDEFTALGRVDIINKAVAYIAGYNMRLCLIFQNRSQSDELYKKEGTQTLLSNMACQVIFAPRTEPDARDYSEMLGTETVKGRSVSRNRGKGGGGSVSVSDQKRELMLPQELKTMDTDKEIVSYQANKPIFADKIKYYEEPVFQERMGKPTPPVPALDIIGMLDVMRGITRKPITTEEELAANDGATLIKSQTMDTFKKLNDIYGFEVDFIGDINNYLKNNGEVSLKKAS